LPAKYVPHNTGKCCSIEEAKDNLKKAIELFLEFASPSEIKNRLKSEIFITNLEVSVG
jgi:predicted RNase H-like HicB family nuclease